MWLGFIVVASMLAQATPDAASQRPSVSTPPVAAGPGVAKTTLTYAPAKAADQKDDQLVCKNEPVMGSRMPVRRCRSVADIKDRALQDRMQIEHAQQNISMH